MTLEKELLGFTNWLYKNNWKLIGDDLCLNTETKDITEVSQLALESCSFDDYYQETFKVGDKVKEVDSEEIVEIKEVIYNKFDGEYQYWYEGEDGEEVYGFAEDFEKID
jgi:hypothetical protein